jgi:hypothetical protein
VDSNLNVQVRVSAGAPPVVDASVSVLRPKPIHQARGEGKRSGTEATSSVIDG